MNTNNVSFGKAIPVANCHIFNKNTNKTESAILYEYDCLDKDEDINEIKSLPEIFYYKDHVIDRMMYKYVKTVHWGGIDNKNFYSLKNEDGRILGILYTYNAVDRNGKKTIVIDRLQSDTKSEYKYVGQSMLAALCQTKKDEQTESICVKVPALTAIDFYTQKCGFQPIPNRELELTKDNFSSLIGITEQKTNGGINIVS
ncbi:hypothetical protein IJD44_02970 [bacterium]|nr:hypothetical protein [bacterium]